MSKIKCHHLSELRKYEYGIRKKNTDEQLKIINYRNKSNILLGTKYISIYNETPPFDRLRYHETIAQIERKLLMYSHLELSDNTKINEIIAIKKRNLFRHYDNLTSYIYGSPK